MGVVPLWRAADAPKQQQTKRELSCLPLMRDLRFLVSNKILKLWLD